MIQFLRKRQSEEDFKMKFIGREDYLDKLNALWRKRGYGWAIWDYDGPFGFVDSRRPDAEYIEIDGRKIDRKMLELLRQK